MTLTVESGVGLPDAESYESVAGLKAYAGKVGFDVSGYTDTQIEQALRRGTLWIDTTYGSRFHGCWTVSTQALQWPRVGVPYRKTFIAENMIPDRLKRAVCEASFRELSNPGGLTADGAADRLKRDKVGDVESEFVLGPIGASISLPVVDALLDGMVRGRATAYVGKAARA